MKNSQYTLDFENIGLAIDLVVRALGLVVLDVLLLLVELVDNLVLKLDLVIESANSAVLVGLLLLDLPDGQLNVLDLLLDQIDRA